MGGRQLLLQLFSQSLMEMGKKRRKKKNKKKRRSEGEKYYIHSRIAIEFSNKLLGARSSLLSMENCRAFQSSCVKSNRFPGLDTRAPSLL